MEQAEAETEILANFKSINFGPPVSKEDSPTPFAILHVNWCLKIRSFEVTNTNKIQTKLSTTSIS
jgi:hypothetical protein